jgi:LysR family glycine cleavage system transcriptional activator
VRLPPLRALRAFEAVGRLSSVKLAARELGVTSAAVTQQLRILERYGGVRLLERRGAGIALTEAGRDYLAPLQRGFESFEKGTRHLLGIAARESIRMSVVPSFAVRWLLPRFEGLRRELPDLEFEISTSMHIVDFGREDVDVAIRFGRGDWSGTYCFPLTAPALVAVVSPQIRGPRLSRSNIADVPLLHVSVSPGEWREWFKGADLELPASETGPRFDAVHLALQAAELGIGVALSREVLVCDALERGTLVAPFGPAVPTSRTYYFVCDAPRVREPKVRRFRDWLKAELDKHSTA